MTADFPSIHVSAPGKLMLLGDEAPVRYVVDAMADYSGGYALLHTQTDAGQLAAAVQEALLSMPGDSPALENANADGFVEALDYQPLDDLIVELELRSHDAQ